MIVTSAAAARTSHTCGCPYSLSAWLNDLEGTCFVIRLHFKLRPNNRDKCCRSINVSYLRMSVFALSVVRAL